MISSGSLIEDGWRAVFIDFYGTVVHEDGEVINKVAQEIFDIGKVNDKFKEAKQKEIVARYSELLSDGLILTQTYCRNQLIF